MGNGDREGEPEEGRGIKLLGLMSSSSLATTSVSKNNRRKGNSFILNGFGADEWPETSGQALRSMHHSSYTLLYVWFTRDFQAATDRF